MAKTQGDAVVEVMEASGGYATLGYLYQHVLNIDGVIWGTKTPFASMRRIVQTDERFFKIKPGLWGLKAFRKKLPFPVDDTADQKQEAFSHGYFQGLLVEMGNLNRFDTYVPPQDKNRLFLDGPLDAVTTVKQLFPFSYPQLLNSARTVDVIWFNARQMPHTFLEVEHSTDIYNSLRKFTDLQDFYAEFVIVAPEARKTEFEAKKAAVSYRDIQHRVKFWDYEYVSKRHSNLSEAAALNRLM